MADAKFGSFEDLLELTAAPLRPVARRLRKVIVEVVPDFVEVVRLGDRAATFGIAPKKMSEGDTHILPHNE